MKNTLMDLNNHLFAQLERLNDEELKGEALSTEIERSSAITSIAKEIVANANLQLSALKLKAEYQGLEKGEVPRLLTGGKE